LACLLEQTNRTTSGRDPTRHCRWTKELRASRQGQLSEPLSPANDPHHRKDANRQDRDGAVDECVGEELIEF
jgi:hypothetical protein